MAHKCDRQTDGQTYRTNRLQHYARSNSARSGLKNSSIRITPQPHQFIIRPEVYRYFKEFHAKFINNFLNNAHRRTNRPSNKHNLFSGACNWSV